MSQVEPSSEKYLVSESVLRENNNNNVDSRKNSSTASAAAAALSSRKSITTIGSGSGIAYSGGSGSGIEYGVVNVAPTPPPLPATGQKIKKVQEKKLVKSNKSIFFMIFGGQVSRKNVQHIYQK